MNLQNRVCFVTGAGGEIGSAIVATLARFGALVEAADLDEGRVATRLGEYPDLAKQCHGLALDVTDEGRWDDVVADILARHGRLDVMVNCAGLFAAGSASIDTMELAEWQRLHAVNVDGAFLGTRAGVRAMREAGGAIVNIGSIVGYFGARSGVAYGSSKAAICGLTMQAAASCVSAGIPVRVNAVHPGYVLTESALADEMKKHGNREAAIAAFSTRNPGGMIIKPNDVAGAVAFLACDLARAINGVQLLVDAGLSTQMPGRAFA
ncbi:SDR family NAD(P)-dependent oxidoreductase [Devosia rhizoryzae]|uniref:SDR family oxidoreductase n=1 Tax=Devosia rhizoryzae TaxID=2774137 RepID=A0ABX7C2N5_9HYPH|nr:SDR family oxidoreductase [Devosia rhizoryzae]QQR38468.1 SDR family oxidoreductase [Devosia rhizoryzae]